MIAIARRFVKFRYFFLRSSYSFMIVRTAALVNIWNRFYPYPSADVLARRNITRNAIVFGAQ
jgi:hypothetical protein